ncbi:MAG: acetyl-CoA acetyltransferase [Acidimicrobiia bacterium]
MATALDRFPVVVGVGQTSQRVPASEAKAPIELLEDAARAAETDAGAALLARTDIVAIVQIASWPYPNPGALVSRRLGSEPKATAVSTVGGNSPQLLVNEMAERIQRGECDVVLIGGAESMHTRWRARREPRVELTWENGGDEPCAWVIGDARPGTNDEEMRHGAVAPTMVYPLFETALRAEAGRDVETHQRHVSEFWSTFSEVAAGNPHAWTRDACSPEEIRTVTPDNRMVVFPYPKRMCANIDVDQGAALLLCSYDAARRAGVDHDRIVFLHAAAQAHDHWFVTERDSLARSPGIAAVVGDTFTAGGIGIDDIAHLDVYSCFPSAVEVAAREIAVDVARPLTVTGGLGFAGGPVNNYPTHAIARMVERLRAEPGAYGLTTALGWYLTKHAAGVWSTRPPAAGFRRVDPEATQARVDAQPARSPAGLVDGELVIEATSVAFDRDGTPSTGVVTALLGDGRRAIARCADVDLLRQFTLEAWEGRTVRVTNDGSTNSVLG